MVDVRQLELNLDFALDEAAEALEKTKLIDLWSEFEGEMAGLSQREHLRVAGDVLARLSGLCEEKANVFWEGWQDTNNTEGPVMGGDWLQNLTRQTQELDFSDLVQRSYRTGDRSEADKADEDSVVQAMLEKASVMEMIDELEDTDLKRQALAVSHAENVSDWVKALADRQMRSPQRLVDLQKQLKMPLIEVWIAALLGGFEMEQRGGFYQTQEVWVGDLEGG